MKDKNFSIIFYIAIFLTLPNSPVYAQVDFGGISSVIANGSMTQMSAMVEGPLGKSLLQSGKLGADDRKSLTRFRYRLDYKPSSDVSTAIRKELIASFLKRKEDFEKSEDVKNFLSSDEPLDKLANLLSDNGLSINNLADVMASYYVSAWELVHKKSASAVGLRAVRDQFTVILARNSKITDLSNMEMQKIAEPMAYLTVILGAGGADLLNSGKLEDFHKLQETVTKEFIKQGMDLRDITITDNGFSF